MSLPLLSSSQKAPRSELNKDAVRYGEFVESIYDSLNLDESSDFFTFSLYGKSELFSKVGLLNEVGKFTITRYIYSTVVSSDMPLFFRITTNSGTTWMGYVAESTPQETKARGSHEIVVAIRGTQTWDEWGKNFTGIQAKFRSDDASGARVDLGDVHKGFLSMYTSKDSSLQMFGDYTMKEQIRDELKSLLSKYKDEKVRITFVGHSLGAALATLAACDMASYFEKSEYASNLTMSLFTFGSPRVGGSKFKSTIEKKVNGGIWRYANKSDPVTGVPPPVFMLFWQYDHVGEEIKVDSFQSPYVRPMSIWDLGGAGKPHNLELYLHGIAANSTSSATGLSYKRSSASLDTLSQELINSHPEASNVLENLKGAFQNDEESLQNYLIDVADTLKDTEANDGPATKRRKLSNVSDQNAAADSPWDARPYSLINKSDDILKDEYKIPKAWMVAPYKDMVLVSGVWVNRHSRPSDLPSYENDEYN